MFLKLKIWIKFQCVSETQTMRCLNWGGRTLAVCSLLHSLNLNSLATVRLGLDPSFADTLLPLYAIQTLFFTKIF